MNRATSMNALGFLGLIMACAGSQARTTTIPPQAPPTVSAAVASEGGGVPKSVLEKYVGEYQLTPQVTAEIRLKGNTLVREMMGQQQVLTPITEKRFKLGGGEVEFETDQAGRVTMIIRNGGEEKRIRRR